jgi:hypothetical protein
MTRSVFAGLALAAVGAFHLVPAIWAGTIPARWPFKPFRRSEKPQFYWIGVAASAAMVVLGLVIAAIGAMRAGL